MKILKQWVSKEELARIQGGAWSPSAHTHTWAEVSKIGSNLTNLATRQHAGLTDVTVDQHHNQTHTLGSHSDFGDYIDQAVKEASSVKFDYVRATGGPTDVIFGDDFAGVNRLYTDASNVLMYETSADVFGSVKIASLVIGSYYLNSLIANNKVPDSDKVDGVHAASFLQSPMGAALDMNSYYIGGADYIRTTGGATDLILGKDIAGVNRLYTDGSNVLMYESSADVFGSVKVASLVIGSYYLNSLIANNKVPDSDKLDGLHVGSFVSNPMTEALLLGGYYIGNADYIRTTGGATDLALGKDVAGVNRLFTVGTTLQYYSSANGFGSMKIASLVIGSYYLNSLIANNKVPDADTVDAEHASAIVTKARVDAQSCDHGALAGRGDDDHSIYYNAARHTKAVHDSLLITVLGSGALAKDHGAAATDMLVNVCYGTASPPAAGGTTIGTLFVKYTA